MRQTLTAPLLLLLWANVQSVCASEPYSGPLYDAHAHMSKGANPQQVYKDYTAAGFDKVALFVKSNKASKVQRVGKGRFIVFTDPFNRKKRKNFIGHKEVTYRFSQSRLDEIEAAIQSGTVRGFGEIYFRLGWAPFAQQGINTEIDGEGAIQLLRVAKKYAVPVQIHLDGEYLQTLEQLLKNNPEVDFVLAHCGYLEPHELAELFLKYQNLYAETSLIFNPFIDRFANLPVKDGKIKEGWRKLLVGHADRVMIGTDYYKKRSKQLSKLAKYYRELLGMLPDDVARAIAFENFDRLFVK